MGTLREHLCTFMIISRSFLLRMRNFSNEVVEKISTGILCLITCFRKLCLLWDNVEKYGKERRATDDNTIRCMRFTSWITKAIDTHSEYVILIAFPLQRWFHEGASISRLYVHYLDPSLNALIRFVPAAQIDWGASSLVLMFHLQTTELMSIKLCKYVCVKTSVLRV